jgi:hypothetical protein
MLDVLDMFRVETRDELGVSVIRDAFADLLFPGTGSLQTRARYFLFVPWMYKAFEEKRMPSAEVERRARGAEIKLIEALLKSDDIDGTIGRVSRASLHRLPSNIYWNGLGVLGIRTFPGSQDQYHRRLDTFYKLRQSMLRTDDGESVQPLRPNWHPGLPSSPPDFPDSASFRLTRVEAEYLRERIMTEAPRSLLALLIDRGKADRAEFPWAHPQFGDFPPSIQLQLFHARNFSEIFHGAPLLYNLMLAEIVNRAELVDEYRAGLREWATEVKAHGMELEGWNLREFWQIAESGGARIGTRTRKFVDEWISLALRSGHPEGIVESQPARRLVHERERVLKGPLARLDNQRARELWSGAAGIRRLTFRWGNAMVIVTDILQGFEGASHA